MKKKKTNTYATKQTTRKKSRKIVILPVDKIDTTFFLHRKKKNNYDRSGNEKHIFTWILVNWLSCTHMFGVVRDGKASKWKEKTKKHIYLEYSIYYKWWNKNDASN